MMLLHIWPLEALHGKNIGEVTAYLEAKCKGKNIGKIIVYLVVRCATWNEYG